jgi:hypothetical protein
MPYSPVVASARGARIGRNCAPAPADWQSSRRPDPVSIGAGDPVWFQGFD